MTATVVALALASATAASGAVHGGQRSASNLAMPLDTGDPTSRITSVQIAGTQQLGPFQTGTWRRIWGAVSGVVAAGDDVVGFGGLPTDAEGFYHYTSQFEVIVPEVSGVSSTIVVDLENRGNPAALGIFNDLRVGGPPATITYPPQLGTGFLQNHGLSYGRVQWQTGVAADVPAAAQGIGLVIARDFGRMLTEPGFVHLRASAGIPDFQRTILFGASQSAWFANTLLAEGYTTSPATHGRVFDGIYELNGAGNWLAINQLAAQTGLRQQPYVGQNSVPLTYDQLLADTTGAPRALVDMVKLTDYYRLRASVSLDAPIPPVVHRYDIAAPHAASSAAPPEVLFGTLGCNSGQPVPLNPTDSRRYERALLLELVAELNLPERATQRGRLLPPSAIFEQEPAPAASAYFNALPGHDLTVPALDENGMPIGGIGIPDQMLPLGRPSPIALPPVSTADINAGCGNFGGWEPFTTAELEARYGSLERYERSARVALNRLAADRFVRRDDIPAILDQLAAQYLAASPSPVGE